MSNKQSASKSPGRINSQPHLHLRALAENEVEKAGMKAEDNLSRSLL